MDNGTCRPCPQCGGPVTRKGAYGPPPTYCSGTCRSKAAYQRTRADGRYQAGVDRQRAKREADRLANARPCPYCGAPMTNRRRVQCGAPDCQRRYDADFMREWHRRYKQTTGNRYNLRYAQAAREYTRRRDVQRRAAGLPSDRQRRPADYAKADAIRRAHLATVVVETFDRREIYARDRWVCGICGRKVDWRLAYPHPQSASLDHIVPVSKGGDHTRANTRLAHFGCNSARGNRGDGDQLALIG